MGTIPAFLLRHTVTVEPYLGTWGSYGLAVPVRCFVQQKLSSSTTAVGVVRFAAVTIIARLDAAPLIPEGSRITLADGTKGYASATAAHDGGGLPTPDHLEIAMTVGLPAYGAPLGGETVVVLRRVKTGQDRYHNDVYGTVQQPVDGCAVRPLTSAEHDTGSRDKTTDSVEVTMPPDIAVDRSDRLRIRGLVYVVDGTPELIRDPMTGTDSGLRVIALRVTG